MGRNGSNWQWQFWAESCFPNILMAGFAPSNPFNEKAGNGWLMFAVHTHPLPSWIRLHWQAIVTIVVMYILTYIWMLYVYNIPVSAKQAVWAWEVTFLFGWFILRIYSCLTVVSHERLLDPSICIQSGHLHFHGNSRSPQRFQAELKHGFPKTLGPFALVKCKLLSLWIDRVPWSTRLGWVWWRFRGCCAHVPLKRTRFA